MQIVDFLSTPVAIVPFLNAGRGPGEFYEDQLPVHVAFVNQLPVGVSALIATADLQGRELIKPRAIEPPRLLGEVLPMLLTAEILPAIEHLTGPIDPRLTGVLLAGDFYTVPALDKRGGTGDVSAVWKAFGDRFGWVVGVAGNHDLFEGDKPEPRRLARHQHYLDGRAVMIAGLRFAGLGGIIGSPHRNHRRTEDDYLATLERLLYLKPGIVITHDGPEGLEPGQRGSSRVRELLDILPPPLLVRGHAHWDHPFETLAGGTQVLNVDARVAILCAKGQCPGSETGAATAT